MNPNHEESYLIMTETYIPLYVLLLHVLSIGILAGVSIGGHCIGRSVPPPILVVFRRRRRRVVSRDMILGNLPPTTYNGFALARRGEGEGRHCIDGGPLLSLLLLGYLK